MVHWSGGLRRCGRGFHALRQFLQRHLDAAFVRDLFQVRPVFGRDGSVGECPCADSHLADAQIASGEGGIHSVFAAEVLQELLVIHNGGTLSSVARHGNMICSVASHIVSSMDDHDLDSPGGRLKWARKQAGFETATDFAKRYGYNPTSYRAYENNQNGFSKQAHELADHLNIPARWLLRGGDLEGGGAAAEDSFTQQAKEMGLSLIPELELGYSMGGGSVFADYQRRGFVPFQRDWLRGFMRGTFADLFVARGSGDSMTPTLLDGDIVLIDTAQKRIDQQDRIWALSYGDLGMIKRVRRLPGGSYRIMSDNPAVSPIDATDEEMHVVGRVVWIGRTM